MLASASMAQMPQKSPTMQARNELSGQMDCAPQLWSAIVQRESQPMLARPNSPSPPSSDTRGSAGLHRARRTPGHQSNAYPQVSLEFGRASLFQACAFFWPAARFCRSRLQNCCRPRVRRNGYRSDDQTFDASESETGRGVPSTDQPAL
jgi:hypothetical protein